MAQKRQVTPEKQLLKLIEDPKAKATNTKTYAAKYRGLSLFSPAAWRGRFSFFKESLRRGFEARRFQQLDIKAINKILGFCIFILICYGLVNLYVSVNGLKRIKDLGLDIKKQDSEIIPGPSILKRAASYYLEKIRERDIFRMASPKAGEVADAEIEPKPPSSKIMEAVQHLKLVGISWSDDPDVMIEDTKALRTFFVKRGQTVGKVKVRAIFKDKVLLSYEGEEIELK